MTWRLGLCCNHPPSCQQHGRCTVGWFNWVPSVLETDPVTSLSADVVSTERITAVHELTHVLGLANPAQRTCVPRLVSLFDHTHALPPAQRCCPICCLQPNGLFHAHVRVAQALRL